MLEIQALTYHNMPPVAPVMGIIPKNGGTLGRDEGNTLALPDPMKSVSRLHLQFSPASRGLYKVSNISSGNPAFVNDNELHSGKEHVLKEGDRILVGGYVLQVHYMEREKPEQAPADADGDTDGSEKDDFLSLMLEPGSLEPKSQAESDAMPESVSGADPFTSGNESLDPLAFFGKDSGDGADSIFQINMAKTPPDILTIAGIPPPAKGNRRSGKETQTPVPPPVTSATVAGRLDRFLEGVGSHPAAKPEPSPEIAVSLPEPESAAAKPARRKTIPSAKADKSAARPSQDAQALYLAFIEGLGIDGLPGREALDSDFIRLAGRLFRGCMQGIIDLMAGRALIKQEIKANVTLITPERNNPLKFSPDATVALLHLLGKQIPGFMEPNEAVEQAFLDLRAHQIGIVSGMQSALNHVLDRFNPNVIGGGGKPVQGIFSDILSLWRKARLWDDYGRYFNKTRESASDHFQSFFGSAFVEAYEKAISQMRPDERGKS